MAFDTSPLSPPTMYQGLPVATRTNPYLDEIDKAAGNAHASLSPGAQEALRRAGAPVGITEQQQPQGMSIASPKPSTVKGIAGTPFDENLPSGQSVPQAIASTHVATPTPVQPVPPTAEAGPMQARLAQLTAPDTGEHNKANIGTSGINQVHSPWARVPLQILEAIGTGFAPGLTSAIPGTQLHHDVLVNQAENAVGQQEAIRKHEEEAQAEASKGQLEAAQAAEQASLPELHEAQNQLKQQGLDITKAKNEAQARAAQEAIEQKLRASGYDPQTGEPLPYEQLSEQQQAVHDWRAAQAEERSATAQLRKAQAENQPEMMKIAQQRLQSAAQTRSVAERRLNLSEAQFEMRSRGTQGGEPLPGAITTDEGTPVGSAFQQNVRPTGQERNRADLATSAHTQIQDIKSIVQRRPDIFGPAAGRKTDFTVWLGSQDPDAQAFRAARTIAGDHLAGVFGGRSEAALQALDSAIGHFKDNPQAMIAGLDQLDKANSGFIQKGTPRTIGSQAAKEPAPANVDPKVKAYADQYFGGDVNKANAAIEEQRKGKK